MEEASLLGPCLRFCLSSNSSVRGVAVLRAGSCLAPPHQHSFPPGWHFLVQVSLVGGILGWGRPTQRRDALWSPACMGWVSCAKSWVGFAFLWALSRGVLWWGQAAAVLQAPLSSLCSRRYPWLKRSLLLLLLLLLLAAAAYGESAWINLWP